MGTGALGAVESTHWPGISFIFFLQLVNNSKMLRVVHLLLPISMVSLAQGQGVHFFGPPAVGFGVGLVSVHRKFPVGTSIVSRRSSRSYSHQSFIRQLREAPLATAPSSIPNQTTFTQP